MCQILFTCSMEWKLVHIENYVVEQIWKYKEEQVDIDNIGVKMHGTITTFNRYLWD